MPFFSHDGLDFHYLERGTGIPLVFQHGLGGDVWQPIGIFDPPPGYRLLAMDCRAHGNTRPLGDLEKIRLSNFADDLLALLNHLGVPSVIVGGISMGAAVSLNFTLRYPERVRGLILSRPAWLDGPMTQNAEIYARIAQLIRQEGSKRGSNNSDSHRYDDGTSVTRFQLLVGQFDNQSRGSRKTGAVPRDRKLGPSGVGFYPRTHISAAGRQDPIHPLVWRFWPRNRSGIRELTRNP
jgi:pimeloyl-ACP methyl ester carboxylesterase